MSEYINSRVCICIEDYRNTEISGRLYHTDLPGEYLFANSGQLMLGIESLLNAVNYPEASTEPRTFRDSGGVNDMQEERPHPTENAKTAPLNVQGKLATFIVHAQYRQNTSWQGSLLWLEENKKQFFRSELELLKLIDSALIL